jgi:hypothetical protein
LDILSPKTNNLSPYDMIQISLQTDEQYENDDKDPFDNKLSENGI